MRTHRPRTSAAISTTLAHPDSPYVENALTVPTTTSSCTFAIPSGKSQLVPAAHGQAPPLVFRLVEEAQELVSILLLLGSHRVGADISEDGVLL